MLLLAGLSALWGLGWSHRADSSLLHVFLILQHASPAYSQRVARSLEAYGYNWYTILLSHSIGQWQAHDQAELQGKEKQNLLLDGRSYNVTLERTQRQGDVKDWGHFFFLQSTTHNKSHKQTVK